jgi:hypothetical protein
VFACLWHYSSEYPALLEGDKKNAALKLATENRRITHENETLDGKNQEVNERSNMKPSSVRDAVGTNTIRSNRTRQIHVLSTLEIADFFCSISLLNIQSYESNTMT